MTWFKSLLIVIAAVLFVAIVMQLFLHSSMIPKNDANMPTPVISKPIALSLEEVVSYKIAYTVGESGLSSLDIAKQLTTAYQKIMVFLNTHQLEAAGMPLAIKSEVNLDEQKYVFRAAIPIDANTPAFLSNDQVKIADTYAGLVLKAVYTGTYDGLPVAYQLMEDYLEENQIKAHGESWEHYVNDPSLVEEGQAITHIYIPIESQ